MNFFQKRNNVIVSFDESDWTDPTKLKADLTDLQKSANAENVRLTALTLTDTARIEIIELLLVFSSLMTRKGVRITWVFNPSVSANLRFLGLENLLGKVEVKEALNG